MLLRTHFLISSAISSAAFFSSMAFCQTANVGLPALGYVLDASGGGQIRPITGIPGAALVGQPLTLSFAVSGVATSAQPALALASAGAAGNLMLVRDGQAQLFEEGSGASAFALSPSGKAVVISRTPDPATATMKIWDSLNRAAPTAEASLPQACPSPKWAVSDDGRRAVASCTGASALLWFDGQFRLAPISPAGFSFLPESRTGAGLDAAGDLHWLDEDGQLSLLRSGWVETPLKEKLAVLVTPRWVLAAAGQTVVRLDRESAESQRFACSCPATGLDAMPVSGLVRLTQAAGPAPVYLFDAMQGRFWFVPSLEEGQ